VNELAERLAAQAKRFAESGAAPVTPRLSATVLLLRPAPPGHRRRPVADRGRDPRSAGPGPGGFEVYLQRRSTSMAFASGMYAFPGGTVDPVDEAPPAPVASPPPVAAQARGGPAPDQAGADWPARLGRPAPEAWAVVRAAVRELTEETGVRLTAADLVPWSRWITPEFEPRRYDTSFFLATLPDGQQPSHVSGEADRTEWLAPADAVARYRSGAILMLPPTLVTLSELAGYRSIDAALAAAAGRDTATPIMPDVDDILRLTR
jgi:8-oxo-dGTP pyrophosphatase MutT (NUDIX family)